MNPSEPQNKGIIADSRSDIEKLSDYKLGAETAIKPTIRLIDGNWKPYEPYGERQYSFVNGVYWDTMACTHFSSGHIIETQIIFLWSTLSDECKEFLKQYLNDPNDIKSFRVSKRFSAIVGGNTPQGNYFQKALQSWRDFGALPDKDLPFGGTDWNEYHNPSLATQELKDKAKKFLDYFDLQYEIIPNYDTQNGFSLSEESATADALTQSPVHIGIPIQASHAIEMTYLSGQNYSCLDDYEPFSRDNDTRPVNFAFKFVVSVKTPTPTPSYPVHFFSINFGYDSMFHDEVKMLQQVLIAEGLMKVNLDTGFFKDITLAAVKRFQAKYSIPQTGYVGVLTRTELNLLCRVHFK